MRQENSAQYTAGTKRSGEPSSYPGRKKTKEQVSTQMDIQLLKTLHSISESTRATSDDNSANSQPAVEEDEDLLFCRSIVPTLRKLPARKNKLAKMQIQQVLFNIEFDE